MSNAEFDMLALYFGSLLCFSVFEKVLVELNFYTFDTFIYFSLIDFLKN